jgi:hypothetical protein
MTDKQIVDNLGLWKRVEKTMPGATKTATEAEKLRMTAKLLQDPLFKGLIKDLIFCSCYEVYEKARSVRIARREQIKKLIVKNDMDFPFDGGAA